MKILYTDADSQLVWIVGAVAKEQLEADLSFMTHAKLAEEKAKGRYPGDVVKDEVTGIVTLSDEQYEAIIRKHLVPENALNANKIPSDFEFPSQEFGEAWVWDGKEITHNLEKVKNIQLARVRAERDELLKTYDGLQMRALDLADVEAQSEIKRVKQELRDSTNNLKSLTPTSVDDVKAATPDLSIYKIK